MKKHLLLFLSVIFSLSLFAAPKYEFRATWFTTVTNIDWPSKSNLTVDQQKAELTNLLDQLAASNINAVCFQVRGRSDAYYKSNYEPWAKELTNTLGQDPSYDPLKFAIEEAHKRGMELHAWINPFRVSTTTNNRLTENDINSLYKAPTGKTKLQWSWVLAYNNGSFTGQIIDPGVPAAREYVVNVLMDIVENYDIDGVVMDDYFYPYGGTNTEDQASQNAYYKENEVEDVNKDGKKLDDWRRSNVDAVIADFSSKVRVAKPWVRFGMGPGGIWTIQNKAAAAYEIQLPNNIVGADLYEQLACNTVEWIKKGWVDYVNPQIYWATTAAKQDYDVLCKWWAKDVCEHFSEQLPGNQRVHFYPSHAGYKVFEFKDKEKGERYEGFGANEAEGTLEMIEQIRSNRENLSSGYTGSVYFKNKDFLDMSSEIKAACYQQKALVPPMAWKATEDLVAPNTLRISGKTLTWKHDDANVTRFTVYIYPKGVRMSQAIEDVSYLQSVVYGKEFTLPDGFDVTTQNVAVRAYDRYGVEYAAAEYGPDVTYVLNGGVLEYTDEIEVPTNEELWEAFKAYFNTYYPSNSNDCKNVKFPRADQPIASVTTFWPSESDGDPQVDSKSNIMTNQNSEFKWLGDYILRIATSQGQTVNSEVLWRFNLSAFFNKEHRTSYPATADFTTAGQPTAWGPDYIAAHSGTTVEPQPAQEDLKVQFMDGYLEYFKNKIDKSTCSNTITFYTNKDISGFLAHGASNSSGHEHSILVSDMMTDTNSDWKWLGDYIIKVSGSFSLDSDARWRHSITAFFNQSGATAYTVDFSTAGKPEAWKAAWDAAHTTAADPETSLYILPDFIETDLTLPTAESNPRIYHPDEYTFVGWIDGNGNSIASLPAGYKGIVYAQWGADITWVLNGGVYTGKGDLPLHVHDTYYLPTAFAMRKDGHKFVGWYNNQACTGDAITEIAANHTCTLYAKWAEATHVTWHPYPYYDVTNEDLWELFVEDYNAFYTNKEILGENNVSSGEKDENISMTGAFGFTYSLNADKDKFPDGRLKEFMTHGKSPWKWLGDYITEVLEEENESLDSNAPLWTSFKEATGLTHLGALKDMDFVKICGTGALDTDDKDGKTGETILTALFAQPEWEWFPDYLITVQNAVAGTVIGKTGDGKDITIQRLTKNNWNDRQWAFAVAAFFLQRQYTTWPASADFSTAGKHSVWKEIIPEEYHELGHFRITNQIEWRKTVAAFFNHTNVLTYTLNSGTTKTEGTADFRTLGLPRPNGNPGAGWYNAWWNATFPEYMIDTEALPRIKRKGYLFGGWYYGNEKGYIFAEGTKADPASYSSANTEYKNHLWGRWLELCLYEGYVDSDPAALGADGLPISPKVNNNYELASCSDGKSHKIDVERKLVGGAYNTMFLPFGINGQGSVQKDDNGNYIPGSGKCGKRRYLEQVVDDQGNKLLDPDKTSILVFDNATVETVGGEDVISFNFHEYAETDSLETLGVYQPILIKPENDITTRMHFWSALMWKPATPKARTDASQANVEGVLAPTVIPVNPEGDNILILVADNRLAKVTASGEMLGLRLYFTVPKDVSPSARSIIRIKDAPTEVENINTPQQGAAAIKVLRDGTIYILRDGKIYDIMGRSLGEL